MAVFIPPAMALGPAVFPRLVQFLAPVIRLLAVPAVVLDGFVQSVVRLDDAMLATVIAISECPLRSREGQHANQGGRGQHHPSNKLLLSRLKFHRFSILSFLPRLGWGWDLSDKTQHQRECSKRRSIP